MADLEDILRRFVAISDPSDDGKDWWCEHCKQTLPVALVDYEGEHVGCGGFCVSRKKAPFERDELRAVAAEVLRLRTELSGALAREDRLRKALKQTGSWLDSARRMIRTMAEELPQDRCRARRDACRRRGTRMSGGDNKQRGRPSMTSAVSYRLASAVDLEDTTCDLLNKELYKSGTPLTQFGTNGYLLWLNGKPGAALRSVVSQVKALGWKSERVGR